MSDPHDYRKIGPLESDPIITRHPANPILRPEDIPYRSSLVYNAGVVKHEGEYLMVFRSDYGYDPEKKKAPHFQIGLARSADGVNWRVHPEPIVEGDGGEIMGTYDPRLTVLEGRFYLSYAQLTYHGVQGVISVTDDFRTFEILDRSLPDNRDIVLFPEKIDGRYLRLDRPFPYFSRSQRVSFDIWISESPDLVYWGKPSLLLCVEDVPFANERLGAGSPPVRTDAGWLVLIHAVDVDADRGRNGWEDKWQSRYTCGAMLLDPDNPRRVIGVSRRPLIVPEAEYEISGGFRNNVIFPMALVPEENGEAKIYYGAADTVVAMATVRMEDLIDHCLEGRR